MSLNSVNDHFRTNGFKDVTQFLYMPLINIIQSQHYTIFNPPLDRP